MSSILTVGSMDHWYDITNWYDIRLVHSGFLADRDYQNYVLFHLFRYVDIVDVTMMEHPYYLISVPFSSLERAEKFCRENDFVQSIEHAVDREMLTHRTYLFKTE